MFMNSFCNEGKIEETFSQLVVMAAQRITPSSVTINILLCCTCMYSSAKEGKKRLEESWKFGWEVNVVDFNAVMSTFSTAGNWAVASLLLVRMVKMGVKLDERSFNILIFCLCREGKIQKARRILENGGFKANTVSYNTLLLCFVPPVMWQQPKSCGSDDGRKHGAGFGYMDAQDRVVVQGEEDWQG